MMIHLSYSKNPAGNKVKVNSLLQVETAKHLKSEGNTWKISLYTEESNSSF